MTKRIPLTKGYFAMVDDGDYEELSQYSWCADVKKHTVYVLRRIRVNGIRKPVYMHQFLLNEKEIDHINGDGLDNQRANLRKCTRSQNNANMRKTRGSSKFKGVHFNKNRWEADITINGKTVYLGRYDNELDAAKAYNERAKALYGTYARLNVFS